jgi:hypothetical protein
MNAMNMIVPYKSDGIWAFDDASRGLVREPFVFGIPEIIEHYVRDIVHSEDGFRLTFSPGPFPGFQIKLIWLRSEYEGNWYGVEGTEQEGWLCPALLKYFDAPPSEIYCHVSAHAGGLAR